MIFITVTLFSTDCPKCCIVQKKLAEKNIEYTKNNSIDEMLSIGITQVPVLEVNGVKMDFKESINWIKEQ